MTHEAVTQNDNTYVHPLGACLESLKRRTEIRGLRRTLKRPRSTSAPLNRDSQNPTSKASTIERKHSKRFNPDRTSNNLTGTKKHSTGEAAVRDRKIIVEANPANPAAQNQTMRNEKCVNSQPEHVRSSQKISNSSNILDTKYERSIKGNPVPHTTKPSDVTRHAKSHINVKNEKKKTDFNQIKANRSKSERSEWSRSKSADKTDPEIWFDDVPSALIAASREDQLATGKSLIKASSFSGPTRRIAIDCEFVGIGYDGKENALARVSVVNQFGHVLLDTLVRPNERVTDYRTRYSGIRPEDLRPGGPARPFHEVHKEVTKLCEGRILVGHSIGNDLKVLMISHPKRHIRDTARYRPFRALFGGRTPSLRALTERVLGVRVQTGEHDSIEDARAAMRLYTSVKRVWESGKKGRVINPLGLPDKLKLGAADTQQQHQKQLDILTEYESGLDAADTTKPTTIPERKMKTNILTWDGSRNRRCSKKRSKFLQKHAKRNGKRGFQSAKM